MKRRLFTVALVIFLTPINAASQQIHRPILSTYTGFGAYSLNSTDVYSFTANQASLAQLKSAALGISGERGFLLNELNNYTAAIGLPTRSGNFGLKTCYYGSTDYNETQLGLAYARKLGTKAGIGVQFNYNGIRIAGYGNAAAISFEIGTILHVTDKLHAGIHINNPVGGKFGKGQQEKLASVYTVGWGYEASEKMLVSVEIIKEEDQPINVTTGIQYKLLSRILARAGISANTSTAWLGVGLSVKTFRIDITTAWHPQLGLTPGVLMIFNFKKTGE